jgi:hypothetical protein
MTTPLKERILKEFKNLIGYLSHYEDEEVEFVSKALDSYRLETIKEIEEMVEDCSDCKAEGVTEMVKVHLSHLKGGDKK